MEPPGDHLSLSRAVGSSCPAVEKRAGSTSPACSLPARRWRGSSFPAVEERAGSISPACSLPARRRRGLSPGHLKVPYGH
jgi:hypothetical protein